MSSAPLAVGVFTQVDGRLQQDEFRTVFASPSAAADSVTVTGALADDETLKSRNVFVVGKNENKTYLSLKLPPNATFVVEAITEGSGVRINYKATDPRTVPFLKATVDRLFLAK